MTHAATEPERGHDLEASLTIAATPAQVWALISDLKRMGDWSPQVVRTFVTPEPVRRGSRMFNLNRQGWKHWPTTGRVVRFEPHRDLAFRIRENRTVWSFQLEETDAGTLVTHRRETPDGISGLSNVLVRLALGGQERFLPGLREGMQQTLERIRAELER